MSAVPDGGAWMTMTPCGRHALAATPGSLLPANHGLEASVRLITTVLPSTNQTPPAEGPAKGPRCRSRRWAPIGFDTRPADERGEDVTCLPTGAVLADGGQL